MTGYSTELSGLLGHSISAVERSAYRVGQVQHDPQIMS